MLRSSKILFSCTSFLTKKTLRLLDNSVLVPCQVLNASKILFYVRFRLCDVGGHVNKKRKNR